MYTGVQTPVTKSSIIYIYPYVLVVLDSSSSSCSNVKTAVKMFGWFACVNEERRWRRSEHWARLVLCLSIYSTYIAKGSKMAATRQHGSS